MAKLFFKHGTMGSSKSANLLMTAKNYELQNKNILIYKPQIDKRWDENMIISRSGIEKKRCLPIKDNEDIYEEVNNISLIYKIHCILVDESQFLTKKQVDLFAKIVDEFNIPVICYGLKTTYKGELFEGSKRLIEMADKIEEIKNTCYFCNKKATHNARFVNDRQVFDGETIVLGDTKTSELNEYYLPVCRKHFYDNK